MALDVLVVAPLHHELEGILTKLDEPIDISGKRVVGTLIGVGKVVSALATQQAILAYQPKQVVLLGFGGAVDPNLEIGSALIATKVVQYDLDLRRFRLAWGDTFGPEGTVVKGTLDLFAPPLAGFAPAVFGTADRFLLRSEREQHPELATELGIGLADMEGYPVALACRMHHIPCILLRIVSDDAHGRRAKQFSVFAKQGRKKLSEGLHSLLEEPREKSPTSL
nr:5'-methylthioadenosine/S-adenosylhomocysteine nucleosidase [uncultured Sphaerochaeta sp.]